MIGTCCAADGQFFFPFWVNMRRRGRRRRKGRGRGGGVGRGKRGGE